MRRALVVGGAACVLEDVAKVRELFEPDAVYAVNDMGARLTMHVHRWCTLHPEHAERWRAERLKWTTQMPEIVGPMPDECGMHGRCKVDRRVSYRWPGMRSSGSSGLFAVKVALEDGFSQVVLAGVPMSAKAGSVVRRGYWNDCAVFLPAWNYALPYIRDRVRSVSGWTAELLGKPTPTWLIEGTPAYVKGIRDGLEAQT